MPLEVQAALQINFLLRPYKDCKIYENMEEIYVPMLWFRQSAKITPTLAVMINIFNFMDDYGAIVLFCLAESLFVITALILWPKSNNSVNISFKNFKANKGEKFKYLNHE